VRDLDDGVRGVDLPQSLNLRARVGAAGNAGTVGCVRPLALAG
jgi:hypothetical protein